MGGTLEEIAASERDAWQGRHSERPYLILCQQSNADPGRAPEGKSTGYAYCHVPSGSHEDMTGRVEAQVERGQLDAGIDRLERLHAEYPDHPDAARLLAQARVRKGTELVTLQDYRGAGDSFDRAVALYELLAPCDGSRCDTTELRLAHRNRVVAWLSAYEAAQARQALADAERAGLRLPALRAELDRLGVSPR